MIGSSGSTTPAQSAIASIPEAGSGQASLE